MVSIATGGGKGCLFARLPFHMPANERMMMLVHTIDLVEQGAQRIAEWNPHLNIGIEMGDRFAGNEQVVVASVQTLGRAGSSRLQAFNPDEFYWLAVDEAHHVCADSYKNVINHFLPEDNPEPHTTLIGYTATPNRADSQALGTVFDEIVFQYSIQDAIRDGWLVDIKGIRVKTTTDISKIRTKDGDLNQDELEAAVNTPERNDLVVKEWIQNCYPRTTAVFCVDVQHAKDMSLAFQKAGIPCEAVWGSDPRRDEKMEMLKKGLLQVIVNVKLLIEGWDFWKISCVVLAAPSKSQSKVVQQVGRGTRLQYLMDNLVKARAEGRIKFGDKVDLLIMDVCDVTGKHSLVTLPSLFGLGSKLDLNGTSVMAAIKALDEAQAKYPEIDLTKLEDITKLKSYVEQANLWTVNFCSEITEASKLQWHRTLADTYRLLLPGREQIVISGDLLGEYRVKGSILGESINQYHFASLPDALAYAEKHLSEKGKSLLTLLRRESSWHKTPMSDGQRKLLKNFKVPDSIIATWNKGQAAKYITQKLGSRR